MKDRQIRKMLGALLCVLLLGLLLAPMTAMAAKLDAPELRSAVVTETGVKVSWKAVEGAESYRVYRKTGDGDWEKLGTATKTSYTDKTVKAGGKYAYTVCCLDAKGQKAGAYDKNGVSVKVPKADAAVNAGQHATPVLKSIKFLSNGVRIKWGAVSTATKYTIFRRHEGGAWKNIGTSTSTSYDDMTAKSGTTYYYTVRAEGGSKSKSGVNAKGLKITFYSVPSLKSAKSGEKGITIKWRSVPGAQYYQVLRKRTVAGTKYISIAIVSGTSYTDTTMAYNKAYVYSVRVVTADGKTALSKYKKSGVEGIYRGKAEVSTLTNERKGVKVTWSKIPGAKYYHLYRRFGDGNWKKIVKTTDVSYVDETAVNGITYFYRVIATDSSSKKVCVYDEVGKAITFYVAPTVVKCERYGTGLRTTWEAVEGVSNYAVYRKIGEVPEGGWTLVGFSNGTSYTDYTVPSATWCWYTVRCADASGIIISGCDPTGKGATSYSDTPVLVSAVNGDHKITITWRAVDRAQYYKVYRRTGDKTSWKRVKNKTTALYFVDTDVVNAETYTYSVSVCDDMGEELSLFNETGISITYYRMPEDIKTANAATGVKVSWKPVDGVGSYRIYRKTGNNAWTVVGTSPAKSFIDTTVVNNGNYRYTVSCLVNGVEVSAYNNTGTEAQFHTAPSISSLVAQDGSVKLVWGAVDGIGMYRIYRKVGNGSWAALTDVTTTNYTDTSVTSGKKYSYYVRCMLSGNVVSAYYNTMTLTYLKAPTIAATSGGEKQTKITWSSVSGAKHYAVYRKTANSGWALLKTLDQVNEYIDTTGVINTVYTYKVVAIAKDGSRSADSDTVNHRFD